MESTAPLGPVPPGAGSPHAAGLGRNLCRAAPVGALREWNSNTWINGGYYLCVTVKEAVDLFPAVALLGATCDSFVRVSLRPLGQGAFLEEADTRTLQNNSCPMWEECMFFPLENAGDDTCIALMVYDKDMNCINKFLGMVEIRLKEALDAVRGPGQEVVYTRELRDRKGASLRKRSELTFGVTVRTPAEYEQLRERVMPLRSPETIHKALREYSLYFKMHAMKEVVGLSDGALTGLELRVCVNIWEGRKRLSGPLVNGALEPTDVEMVVPMAVAYQGADALRGDKRDKFAEVRLELYSGRNRLAKTQVPIWDVPYFDADQQSCASGSPRKGDADSLTDELDAPHAADPGTEATGGRFKRRFLSSFLGPKKPNPAKEELTESPLPAPSPPRALWDGRRYARRMERLSGLDRAAVIEVSMQLVPNNTELAGTDISGAADRVDFAAPDVDAPGEPLAVPPALEMPVANFVVSTGPHALMREIWGENSELAERANNAEGVKDLQITSWGPDPEGTVLAIRELKYKKSTPVGLSAVDSVEKIITKADGGFVVTKHVKPHIPFAGQAVRVDVQIVGHHIGPNKTRLTASLALVWLKDTALKGKVQANAPKETVKSFVILRDQLATKYQVVDGAGAEAAADGTAGAGASGAQPVSIPLTAASPTTASDGPVGLTWSLLVVAAFIALAGLVLLLQVGQVARMRGEVSRSGQSLETLRLEVQQLVLEVQRLGGLLVQRSCPAVAPAAEQ